MKRSTATHVEQQITYVLRHEANLQVRLTIRSEVIMRWHALGVGSSAKGHAGCIQVPWKEHPWRMKGAHAWAGPVDGT